MNTVQIKLYDIFRVDLQLSDSKAAALVSAVEEVVELKERENNHSNATKDDVHLVQKDINLVQKDLYRLELKIEQSKNETYSKIEQSKNETYSKIEQSKNEMYSKIEQTNQAIYISGLIQFLGILSGLIAIVKLMK